jgi:serine protease Do
MSVVPQAHVVIRHLSGSKINQVEQFPLEDLQEITIGRDPHSDIAYDQRRDDVVSRRHAAIRIQKGEGDNFSFWLRDLNSSNGTLLNGARVEDEIDLLPEDTIELGPGGPKFTFDVEPRPQSLASRTRMMGPIEATATRAVASVAGTAEHPAGTKEIGAALRTGTRDTAGGARAVVGRDTVMRMLFQEREKSTRIWMSALAAVLAVLVVTGGGLYWHSRTVANQLREEAMQRAEQERADRERTVTQQIGATAKDIANKYGASTVRMVVAWRMHDMVTGKPLYHKVVLDHRTNQLHAAFIRMPNGKLVRWLTLEDPDRRNIAIRGDFQGSGFVVRKDGLILTNKHLAAGYKVPFDDVGQWINKDKKGIIFTYNTKGGAFSYSRRRWQRSEYVSLDSSEIKALEKWIPEFGGPVFSHKAPVLLDGTQTWEDNRLFNGVTERLEVRFPGERLSINATLVQASNEADVALVKVEALGELKPVELAAEDDKFEVGDKVIVLGYPDITPKTRIQLTAVENARISSRPEVIPNPTVNEGIISALGQKFRQEGEFTVVGALGDTFQMSINATGAGNSGGPVFNSNGKVIGLYTYSSRKDEDGRATYAVPIHHGRALLKMKSSGL